METVSASTGFFAQPATTLQESVGQLASLAVKDSARALGVPLTKLQIDALP